MVRGGALLRNSADAFALYPGFWTSPAAARKAFQRAAEEWDKSTLTGVNLYKKYSLIEIHLSEGENVPLLCHPLEVVYKPQGPGQKPRTAKVWPPRIATFRSELEAAIGPLALFTGQSPNPPREDTRTMPDADAMTMERPLAASTPPPKPLHVFSNLLSDHTTPIDEFTAIKGTVPVDPATLPPLAPLPGRRQPWPNVAEPAALPLTHVYANYVTDYGIATDDFAAILGVHAGGLPTPPPDRAVMLLKERNYPMKDYQDRNGWPQGHEKAADTPIECAIVRNVTITSRY
jgi:hypothetical protein